MILLNVKDWHLNKDEKHRGGYSMRLDYWLSHRCKEADGMWVQRYFSTIDEPCSRCGSQCPEALRGMYNMMVYV